MAKQVVIENPVLNSPFEEPTRHWRFDEEGITNEVDDARRVSSYFVPIAQPRKKNKQLSFDSEWTKDRIEENKEINRIRAAVSLWRERGYPRMQRKRQNRCDLVTELPEGGRLWLEVKGAWKTYWCWLNKEWIYRSYLFYPLIRGLDDKSHTVPKDLAKLARLTQRESAQVGVLLIGFDSDEYLVIQFLPRSPKELRIRGSCSPMSPQ